MSLAVVAGAVALLLIALGLHTRHITRHVSSTAHTHPVIVNNHVAPQRADRSRPITLDERARPTIVTAYTWTGHRTASGVWPEKGMAASNLWPLGTRLHVEGIGVIITDRVGHGTELDLYLPTRDAAIRFGRRTLLVDVVR